MSVLICGCVQSVKVERFKGQNGETVFNAVQLLDAKPGFPAKTHDIRDFCMRQWPLGVDVQVPVNVNPWVGKRGGVFLQFEHRDDCGAVVGLKESLGVVEGGKAKVAEGARI